MSSRDVYSRAEKLSDATIHVLGVTAALIAVSVLITLAAFLRPEPNVLFGTAVYGTGMLMMLTASAAYHMSPWAEWKDLLRRIDQSAIYVKIAATYTPFAILTGTAPIFLVGMWLAAAVGFTLKMLAPERFELAALALYLCMGWAGVVLAGDLIASLTTATFILMLIGGIIYTVGVAFFIWERLPFHNTIWHAHVLVATGVFYAAVVVEVAHRPGVL
ncbi:MAG: hemolysin III family protein [Pseudomonadota bacterium]